VTIILVPLQRLALLVTRTRNGSITLDDIVIAKSGRKRAYDVQLA
jgi:hypothetical protein